VKKIIISIIALSTFVFSFDMTAVSSAIDTDKASDSVDKEKLMKAFN